MKSWRIEDLDEEPAPKGDRIFDRMEIIGVALVAVVGLVVLLLRLPDGAARTALAPGRVAAPGALPSPAAPAIEIVDATGLRRVYVVNGPATNACDPATLGAPRRETMPTPEEGGVQSWIVSCLPRPSPVYTAPPPTFRLSP